MERIAPVRHVGLHCLERYRERVAPHPPKYPEMITLDQAAKELLAALERPLFRLPLKTGDYLLGCVNVSGYPFLVRIDAARQQAESCGPLWFWHEARNHWKRLGYDPKNINRLRHGNAQKARQKL